MGVKESPEDLDRSAKGGPARDEETEGHKEAAAGTPEGSRSREEVDGAAGARKARMPP